MAKRYMLPAVAIRGSRPYVYPLLAALAAVVAMLCPAVASAANPPSGTWWIGPSLAMHSANTTESSSEDDLFYLIFDALNNQQSDYTMPYDGQITDIQTEGGFLTSPSEPPANPVDTMVHFQDLAPAANGSWLVNATSGFFQMPTSTQTSALANQISEFHPENLCVHQGDVVDLNTEGGFQANQPAYHNGVPLLLFDDNSGSSTAFFHGNNQTGNGSTVQPTTLSATLLMRVQLAVGADATPLCPGGTQGLPSAPGTTGLPQGGGTPVTQAPTLAGLSPPVLYKTADIAPVRGVVYIKLPAGSSAHAAEVIKGQRFVPLTQARQISFGSELDTRHGVVAVVTASASSATAEQTAQFQSGIFQLLQRRSQRSLTTATLIDLNQASVCRVGKLASVRAAARRRLSTKTIGRLNATVSGKFSTVGKYSAATVRGTQWEESDRCDGTFTRVRRGVVIVRDFRLQRTITLTAGKSYLARAP
jgi:hypothetical protein